MAVIDRYKLSKNYDTSKLTASSRILLEVIITFTNRSGYGFPTWDTLMRNSGIIGNDTFIKAREQLQKAGLITFKKDWIIIKINNRTYPRSRTYYQVSKNILWDNGSKDRANHNKCSESHSMATESMESGSEDVVNIGVNKIGVNKQTSSVNNNSSNGLIQINDILKSKQNQNKNISNKYEWQVHAERVAESLSIKTEGNKSWYLFFKEAHKNNEQSLLDSVMSYCADYPNPKDIEKLFYYRVNESRKGRDN